MANSANAYTKKGRVGFKNNYKLKFEIKYFGTPELSIQMLERLQAIFPEITETSFAGLGIDGPPIPVSNIADFIVPGKSTEVITEIRRERKAV